MWAVPKLVITARSGSQQRLSRSISPRPRMPISTTTARCSAVACSRVRGTPMSLFSLPWLAHTGPVVASTERSSSRVVVFPAEPVTASTGTASWRRQSRPSSW